MHTKSRGLNALSPKIKARRGAKPNCKGCESLGGTVDWLEGIVFDEKKPKPLDVSKLDDNAYVLEKTYELATFYKSSQLSLLLGWLVAKALK